MQPGDIEQLRQLDMSGNEEDKARLKAISDRRDVVLAYAVIVVARDMLAKSSYLYSEAASARENNERAVTALQDYLSGRSSVPEMEQRLLALVGRGVLFGRAVPQDMLTEAELIGLADERLDPTLVHRLSRALDRSDEQEPLLWSAIDEVLTDEDDPLVRPAVRLLLDDVTISNLDASLEKMVLDSIPGG